jgi:hypothetical protein
MRALSCRSKIALDETPADHSYSMHEPGPAFRLVHTPAKTGHPGRARPRVPPVSQLRRRGRRRAGVVPASVRVPGPALRSRPVRRLAGRGRAQRLPRRAAAGPRSRSCPTGPSRWTRRQGSACPRPTSWTGPTRSVPLSLVFPPAIVAQSRCTTTLTCPRARSPSLRRRPDQPAQGPAEAAPIHLGT